MNADTYQKELLKILRAHSEQAIMQLEAIDAAIPSNARKINVGIHPNQEPDGTFSVIIHLDGPDLHSLNKAIEGNRYLFDVRFVDSVLTPKVPMFDPFDLEFEVNDVIVDTAIIWLEEVWATFGGTSEGLPTTAFGEDGFGTMSPKKLAN